MEYTNRPLVNKLIEFQQKKPVSLHVPGHKNGMLSGLPSAMRAALSFDVTELNGLDDLHQPEEVIKEAQEQLSRLYKTEASYFLVNGSTVGNLAMIYATCSAGDFVIVQRNAHKSIFNALELVGAKPVLVTPEWDEATASIGTVSNEQITDALRLYPIAKAVILTYPTYYGTTGNDLEAIVSTCHQQKVPVLVDEAHGAHFVIGDPFPKSALTLGADVVVHSAHKTLPAMTMSSFLHINNTSLVSRKLIERYLGMLQSSSPSYLLMASLDDARAYAESYTDADMKSFLKMRKNFINQLIAVKGLQVVESEDPLKLMIRADYYTGFQLLDALEKEDIYVELADPYQVLFILPLLKAGHAYQIDEFIMKLNRAIEWLGEHGEKIDSIHLPELTREITELCYNRNELEQFQEDWLPYEQVVGKVAATSIIPYPPGIPLVLAGERISREAVKLIKVLTTMKARFHGEIHIKEKQILVLIDEVGE